MPPVDKDAKIPCPTPQHLQAELEALSSTLELVEKEETWEKLERALIRFAAITRGGGYKHGQMYIDGVGRQANGLRIVACMMSDRGRLSGVGSDLIQTLAPRLGTAFAPLVSLYMDPLIRLLGRPNKVVLKRTDKCLSTMISHCHLPSIVFELRKGLNDDAVTCRRGCALAIERAVSSWDVDIWGEKGVCTLEDVIRKVAADKDAEVRNTAKTIWGLFCERWPERVDDAPLTPTTRRRLDIAPAAGQAGPSKPKAPPARKMAPPAAPVRAVAAIHAESSSANPPLVSKVTLPRVKSASVHPSKLIDESRHLRSAPANSAPTSPAKERPHPGPSRPGEPSTRHETIGMPSRSASHHMLSSTATISHVTDWSKPQRPGMPSSYSAISLPVDAHEQPTGARRFPPPARSARPGVSSHDGEEHLFGGLAQPLAGSSILRGPVRIPQHPPAGIKIGPAQRRVVTAPVVSLAATARPLLPSSSSSSQLDMQAAQKSARVKKRVEELEEEIRVSSQPSSPVVPMPSPKHTAHLSPLPNKKSQLGAGNTDSPLLPVLLRSTGSRPELQKVDEEDLRNVQREEEEGDLTVMDSSVVMGTSTAADRQEQASSEIAAESAVLDESDVSEAEPDVVVLSHDDAAMAVPAHVVICEEEDLPVPEENEAETRVDKPVELDEESKPHGAEQEYEPESGSEEEEEETVEERTYAQYNLAPPTTNNDEYTTAGVTAHSTGEQADNVEKHEEIAKAVPLPCTPPHEPTTIPLPPDEEMEPLPAPVAVPTAVWPKEEPPAPRVISQNMVKRTVTAKPTVAGNGRTAAAPRKPPVPPPPVRSKAGLAERKTFKPTTAASRATAIKTAPGVSAPNPKHPRAAGNTTDPSVKSSNSNGSDKRETVSASAATKTSAALTAKTNPRVHIGKGSTAPAMVARSVSAASTSSSRPPSAVPPKPPVPKANTARVVSKTENVKTAVQQSGSTAPIVPAKIVRPAVKPSAQVSIPPVRQDKMRRKAPLPSFRPVRAKDKEKSALASSTTSASAGIAQVKPGQTTTTVSTSRAKVKPESIPLPASPKTKTIVLPREVPLPQSPVSGGSAPVSLEKAASSKVEPSDETAACGLAGVVMPSSRLASPLQHKRRANVMSSPISVPGPRVLSPVLTTSVPPSALSPTNADFETNRRDIPVTCRPLDTTHGTPTTSVMANKLVDVPTPGSIPSPFLDASGRPFNPALFARGGNHSPPSKSVTEPANDSMPGADEDEDDLDGVTTTLGLGARSLPVVIPKSTVVNVDGGDLMEFSASSRPAQGKRRDVSTPMKGAEVLLSKLIGTPKSLGASPNVGTRVALSARDANGGA